MTGILLTIIVILSIWIFFERAYRKMIEEAYEESDKMRTRYYNYWLETLDGWENSKKTTDKAVEVIITILKQ